MKFSNFSNHLSKIEAKSSRLDMTALLAELYQALGKEEVVVASYLLKGSLVPEYKSLEFQLSNKMVIRALARVLAETVNNNPKSVSAQAAPAAGVNLFGEVDFSQYEKQVSGWYKKLGDIGLLAEKVLEENSEANSLSILDVYEKLTVIAQAEGTGSQERKISLLVDLFKKLDALSGRYVARIIIGRLRLGFSTMTMLDALSWSVTGGKDEAGLLESAYQRKADVGELAQDYLSWKNLSADKRQQHLEQIEVEVGIPVVPALCQRLNSAAEIIDKMEEVYAEPKYDGLRVQIHYTKGETPQVFTRSLDNISHMFPELEIADEVLKTDSCILDGEAIGVSPQTGKLVSFQETITRRRKHGVSEKAKQIPIRFYIFDVLSNNNQSLIKKPLQARKDLLKGLFKKNEVFFQTPYILTADPKELRDFHEQQLGTGLEGAVMKQKDSQYVGGRKGWNWVKIKEAEGTQGKLADTLDCVVMGYYFGRGKRTQFGLGAILVGVLDEGDDIVTIAKIGTGLSEQQLTDIKKLCDQLAVDEPPKQYQVHKDLNPDVWVSPEIVVEIAADEVTKSPTHSAKVALRFPRLLKVRDDKTVEQATTLEEVKTIL